MSLITTALVRNEMHRFWPEALKAWATFSDQIVILDDSSDDGTDVYAREFGAQVYAREGVAAWGKEAPARAELFDLAWAHAKIDDYILVLDADMTPAKSPRMLMETGADAIAFTLYDLWERDDEERLFYRSDDFWRGHLFPRVWMIRKKRGMKDFEWTMRGIHCGHFPSSLHFDTFAYAPKDYALLHFAYMNETLRQDKYVSYARVASGLTDFEIAHARSILDPKPHLEELPFTPDLTLL